MKLTLEQIAEWTEGTLHLPANRETRDHSQHAATGYSIDSRTVQLGEAFFAVSGERFDAHSFVAGAFQRGAAVAVVSADKLMTLGVSAWEFPLIAVDEPLAALQRLAAAVRRSWDGRVVGITGSAGKTTTKEAVAVVLAARYNVLKSRGNLNNGFGVPLQLLRLEPEHEIAVIEMGMSHAGEIAMLAQIAAPDWGVITNVGNAHAENFEDGVAGIARAKYELIEGLKPGGVAFLNCDDPRIAAYAAPVRGSVTRFGSCAGTAVTAERVEEFSGAQGGVGLRIDVRAGDERAAVRLQLLGAHNVGNALAALAVGLAAGVPLAEGAKALATLAPGDKRGEVLSVRGGIVINDCYNSNPEALKAMIRTLAGMRAKRRILVAGEMLELGPEAAALHAQCGTLAAEQGIDVVIGVRGLASHLVEAAGSRAIFVHTPEAAGEWLHENLRAGDVTLLKASRGVQLERALPVIK